MIATVRVKLIAFILLFSLSGFAECQFDQFDEYFPEQMPQYKDLIEEVQDFQYIQDDFYPLDQENDIQDCHNSEGEQACLASAGTVRVGGFGKCYCDLPDGRSCDFQDLIMGRCEEQPSPGPEPDSECSGTLQGSVVDASTGLPISGAAIDASCRTVCPTTNELGYYSITHPDISLCPGTSRKVECSADGYQPATNYVPTDSKGDITCDFQLVPLSSPAPEPEPEPESGLYSFTVTVIDSQNNAVEGAGVTVDNRSRGMTGSDGRLEVQLADGEHDATAFGDDTPTGYWSGKLNHELNREFAITIPERSSPEPKEPSIRIVSIDPAEGTILNAGDSAEFTFTVEYDLGDNEYGKINVALDRFTMGRTDAERAVPDDTRDISIGGERAGSYKFTLTDTIGLDWSNVYIFADLYAAKKDNPIPATVSTYDYKEYPLDADAASSAEISFEGTAREFSQGNMPGSPAIWEVTVDKLISGPQPCNTPIDVVTGQSIYPPIWGSVDKSVESGDKVEVYGSYIAEDEGCRVTLHGSESFYFKKATCNGVVRGHVRDAQTNQPIEGASLECSLYCNGSVTTDSQGYYELGSPACNICGLVYCSVTCSADSYEQQVQSLVTDVDGNGKKDLDFYLQPDRVSNAAIQGEVIDTPHCSPVGSQPDHYVKVRIKKVVQNPDTIPEIVPGSIITVRGKECSSVNDLVKERCYEFHGDWREGALWIIFSNIKQIDCASNTNETENPDCGEIIKYDISNGRYATGQIILADMEYKSYLNEEVNFQGVLLLRSSKGDIYSNRKIERTPAYGTDQFGYWNRGNQIDVRIPENAPEGWYSAKLQLINQDTGTICDETEWLERQFEIYRQDNGSTNNCSEIKLKGTCLEVKDLCWGSSGHKLCEIWVVKIDEVENGQMPDVDVVEVYSGLPSTKGFHDENIQAEEKVAVYGCGNGKYVSIAAEERYYIRRISASPCQGVVSGRVYDAKTGLPIKGAGVCDDQDADICHVCYTTNDTGYYAMGPEVRQDSGCHFCPNTSYQIRVYNTECYNISDNRSSTRTVTTDENGNAKNIDFRLTPIKCRSSECEKLQTYGPIRTDECGNKYQAHNTCECKGCNCICDNRMVEESIFERRNSKPVVDEFSGPGLISIGTPEQFTLVGNDKDGDRFYFEIDWRDGTPRTMTFLASSGEKVKVSHTWRSVDCLEGVRARAIDVCGGPDGTSDWEERDINIRA